MKITIAVANAAPGGPPAIRVLGDDAVRDFIKGWAPEAWVDVQTSAPPRAEQKIKFGRANRESRATFTVDRTHASYAAALTFAGKELSEVPGLQGLVTISQFGGNGSASLTIDDAVIARVSVVGEITGVSTLLAYTIEGGRLRFTGT